MADQQGQFDPIERMLNELNAASHAGVFRETELSDDLSSIPSGTAHFARRALAVAATIALAAGVWTTVFQTPSASAANPYTAMAASLDRCMTGPSNTDVPSDCAVSDLRGWGATLASAAPTP